MFRRNRRKDGRRSTNRTFATQTLEGETGYVAFNFNSVYCSVHPLPADDADYDIILL